MKKKLHSIKHYHDCAKGDEGKMEEMLAVVDETLCTLPPEEHLLALAKMHCIAYGPHFDECLAKKAVSALRNVDKTTGGHWTMEQTNQIAGQIGIKEKCDFYFAINMLYSDFCEVLGKDDGLYAKLARAYINDPDAPEGKTFKRWIGDFI